MHFLNVKNDILYTYFHPNFNFKNFGVSWLSIVMDAYIFGLLDDDEAHVNNIK